MKCLLFSLFAGLCIADVGAVSITVNQVQQRYPWNGIVDIDYTIALGDGEFLSVTNDTVSFEATDASVSPVRVYCPATFLSLPHPLEAGRHRVAWNANADGFTNRSASVSVKAMVTNHAEQYMIIDVSGGTGAEYFPVTYMAGAPAGGFASATDNTYRGDKIALRLIWPGGCIAGSPDTETKHDDTEIQHVVSFTNAFYIGVFEMTQKQWLNVMGTDPASSKGDFRPVESVSYGTVRGGDWPTSSTNLQSGSFIDVMRKKCRAQDANGQWTVELPCLDLPTEFQWEYACRAGTATPVYDGVPIPSEKWNRDPALKASLLEIARHSLNTTDGRGDSSYTTTTIVGMYRPNAWGLYDMSGNVQEWCRDHYTAYVDQLGQVVEPVGPGHSGTQYCLRGGSYLDWVTCRSACRRYKDSWGAAADYGCRLSMEVR